MHPKERPAGGSNMDRRDFLKRSAGWAAVAVGGAALLAPWGHVSGQSLVAPQQPAPGGPATQGPAPFQIASPDHPRTLPLFDDNPAIASGLQAEKGITLQIYNWEDYIWRRVVNNFGQHYGVKVEITTFDNSSTFLQQIASQSTSFDITFPTPDLLGKLVAGKILQPLNLDYLPNLKNVWPNLQSPYYDVGSRYSVPYTIYSTGIGWRSDLVGKSVAAMPNPYDIFWDRAYRGKTFILDDYREAPAMVLLRNGITNINTGDPRTMTMVRDQLLQMVSAVNVKFDVNDYTELPEGRAAIHQAWSGDMLAAPWYEPKGGRVSDLRYWFPNDGRGVLGSDIMSIPRNAKNPVLAHLFLNYMLDFKVAYANMANFNGYQPPQNRIDPDRLVADEVVPKNLATAVVDPSDFDRGFLFAELPPATETLWRSVWQDFTSGG
jgi:spermidine/putrescine transport system substrate-binding protein